MALTEHEEAQGRKLIERETKQAQIEQINKAAAAEISALNDQIQTVDEKRLSDIATIQAEIDAIDLNA